MFCFVLFFLNDFTSVYHLLGTQFIFVERRRDEKGGEELLVGVDGSCLKDDWLRLQDLLQGFDPLEPETIWSWSLRLVNGKPSSLLDYLLTLSPNHTIDPTGESRVLQEQ